MKILLFVTSIIFLSNCQNNLTKNTRYQAEIYSNRQMQDAISKRLIKLFISNKDTFLKVCDSVYLSIPYNCFSGNNGEEINGKVLLEVYWANSIFDFISLNLSTFSNNTALQTYGMIYINGFEENGNQLKIRKGKKIELHYFGNLPEETKIFNGIWINKSINWTNAENKMLLSDIDLVMFDTSNILMIDSKKYLFYNEIDLRDSKARTLLKEKKLSDSQIDSVMQGCQRALAFSDKLIRHYSVKNIMVNSYSLKQFGWYNLDCYLKLNGPYHPTLNARIVNYNNDIMSKIFIILKNKKLIVEGTVNSSGEIKIMRKKMDFQIPQNETGDILVLAYDENKIYASKTTINFKTENRIKLVEMGIDEIKKLFNNK